MPLSTLTALYLAFAIGVLLSACHAATPRSNTAGQRPGRYPTTEGVAQLAVDDPCRYLGTVHKMSREIIERLRAKDEISLEEWSCMTDVIVDANYEVGLECHRRKVEFREFAERQEEGYRACLTAEHRGIARCAVIQVDVDGRAGFCD